jgi:hypothetical protein
MHVVMPASPVWTLACLVFLAACPASRSDGVRDAAAPFDPSDKTVFGQGAGGQTGASRDGAVALADGAPVYGSGMGGSPPPLVPGSGDPPGPAISDPTAHGPTVCANTTLAEVIAAVHAGWPMLSDITVNDIAPQSGGIVLGDPPRRLFAFAYQVGHDEGFALVFKRGGGDCPSGCTDNEYWFFRTDASCKPDLVGHLHSVLQSQGSCFAVEGQPMWGFPSAVIDFASICGADNRAQKLAAGYLIHGKGHRIACTAAKSAEPMVAVEADLMLQVTQDPADLSVGTITITGSGEPRLDGRVVSAMFKRQRLTAEKQFSNLPAQCIDQQTVHVDFDVEAGLVGHLRFDDVRDLDCPPSQGYCKGYLDLELTP